MSGARRLDWRFLLPYPTGGFDHLLLLGGDAALAGKAIDLGIARRASVSLPAAQPADLVAVLAGARIDPRHVAAALAPGGAWYWEIERRSSLLAPGAAVRRLTRAGLGPSIPYWVRGGFARPGMFLPLDRDAALRWYFTTIFRGSSAQRRALRAGLGLLTQWRGRRFARLVPRYALVGTDGHPPSVIEAVGEDRAGPDPRPLVLLGGEGDWSRITLIPFPARRGPPATVVKIARRAVFSARTAQEQRILHELHTRAPAMLRGSIPQPMGFHEWRGLGFGVESCAPGRPLFGEATRRVSGVARRLALMGSWLAALHETTQCARLHGEALRDRIVRAPLAAYETAFGHDDDEARLFARARQHADRVPTGAGLPIVLEHGDLGPWNVFRDGDAISVVDWEAAHEGPALCDLLYFATHSATAGSRDDLRDAARRAALPLLVPRTDPVDEAARRALLAYARRLGIAAELYPLLVLYTFVEQALERVARLTEQGDPTATDRASNPYVACVGALAREDRSLFAEVA